MLGVLALAAGLLVFAGTATAVAQAPTEGRPWMNPGLSADTRADLVQAEMTRAEELLLLKGYYGANVKMNWIKPAPAELRPLLPGTAGFVPGIARLGIPPLRETDAGVGIANTNWMRPGDLATAFPSGLSNAATWNPEIAFATGAAIGTEARDRGFNVVLDGAMNLAREPRGGRTFEYAGEDPLLAGLVVGEEIRGIQSEHVISTIKHFALNDQETGRGVLNANIDEAAARESDLLAFEIAIEHGTPGAVMCAYNRVNSVYACENDFLLNRVLKGDWAYAGWVLSDWGGVHSTVAAANGGLDQESASGFDRQEFFDAPLQQAITDGSIAPARLHDMVHRILRTMFAGGLIDHPTVPRNPSAHVEAAEHSAEEGIVLLKNEGALLPLSKTVRWIAVIGGHANLGMLSGGGSSQVLPLGHVSDNEVYIGGGVIVLGNGAKIMPLGREIFDPPSPLAALRRALPGAQIDYADGSDIDAASQLAAQADVAIVFAQQWMTEGEDAPDLSLPGNQNALIAGIAAANPHTIVVLETGGPVTMPWLPHVPAVLEAWYAGNGGATALTRILLGDVNPSGRLPITFPQSESQLPRPQLSDKNSAHRFFDVDYTEGADVGYRWFELRNQQPLFPFGFGLSYTSFAFGNLQVMGGDILTAQIDITNTGTREGSEAVQLYATPPASDRPVAARLVGWTKVRLRAGETQRVTIATEPRLLAHFDRNANLWRISEGDYTITARASAADVRASATVALAERAIKP